MGAYQSKHHSRDRRGHETVKFIPAAKKHNPRNPHKVVDPTQNSAMEPPDKPKPGPISTFEKPTINGKDSINTDSTNHSQCSTSPDELKSPLLVGIPEPTLEHLEAAPQEFIIRRKGIVYRVPLLDSPESSSLWSRRKQPDSELKLVRLLSATDDVP